MACGHCWYCRKGFACPYAIPGELKLSWCGYALLWVFAILRVKGVL